MDRISRTTQRFLALAAACAALAFCSAAASAQTTTTPAPVSVGHSGWYWGSPTPQGQDLASIAFDGTTGYAVGALGTVLRSQDGGQTWTGVASGTTDDLDHVQELSPTTVIAGGGCTVLESTDAGASFTILPLGLPVACEQVAGVSFSTPAQGYVELQNGAIFYTDDSGQTVQARSSVPLGPAGVATGLAFLSPTTGLAISDRGLVELTTDGGNSWNQVLQVSEPLYGITVLSPTDILAVGDGGVLIHSTDGGQTWTTLPLAIVGSGVRPDLRSITCADANDCLITTDDSNQLVRTTDGGMTGTIVSVSDSSLSGVAFTSGTGVVGVGENGATVVSHDGGQTFPTVSPSALSQFDGTGGLVAGRTAGSAYQPGVTGTLAATTDSGAQWSLLRVPTTDDLASVAFASDSVGYTLDTAGTLRRTTDGGTSWSSFAPMYSPHSDLVATGRSALLLVGPRGVRRSTDSGQSFRSVRGRVKMRHGRGARVASLRLFGATAAGSAILAFGPGGRFVSTDGGRVWRAVHIPVPERKVRSVSAVTPNRMWLLGDSGRMYETTDGGRRWSAEDSIGALGVPVAVSFASRQDGLVALGATRLGAPGDFGDTAVLSTHDGGRTWEPQVVAGTGLQIAATPTADYGTGYFGGRGNTIGFFATTDGGAAPAPSRLRISTGHRVLTHAALRRARHSVLVRGHLSPVLSPNEVVAISYRSGSGRWSHPVTARVATGGSFVVRLRKITGSTEIVAQALGDGRHGGAGTPVLHVTVRR